MENVPAAETGKIWNTTILSLSQEAGEILREILSCYARVAIGRKAIRLNESLRTKKLEVALDTKTIISLVIGGFIGFFFSVLTNYIKDKQAKKWEQEKKYKEDSEKIIHARLASLEEEIMTILGSLTQLGRVYGKFQGNHKSENIEMLISLRKQHVNESIGKIPKLLIFIFYFNDESLMQEFGQITRLLGRYTEMDDKFFTVLKSGDKDIFEKGLQELEEQSNALDMKLADIGSNFLKIVDVLKVETVKEFESIKQDKKMESILRKNFDKK